MKASLLFLLVGCLLIMVGCAGVKTSEVAIRPPTQYRFCQQQEGLTIAVDPFLEEERLKTFFGTDLLLHGILPILVVAENLHPKSGYILEKQFVFIATKAEEKTDTEGVRGPGVSLSKGMQGLDKAGWTLLMGLSPAMILVPGVALASLPVLLAMGIPVDKAQKDVRNINENLKRLAFIDRTIFQGESISGFIYFEIKDRESAKKVDRVLVKAKTILSDKDLDFIIRIKE